jgi:hypothetical protein
LGRNGKKWEEVGFESSLMGMVSGQDRSVLRPFGKEWEEIGKELDLGLF